MEKGEKNKLNQLAVFRIFSSIVTNFNFSRSLINNTSTLFKATQILGEIFSSLSGENVSGPEKLHYA